MPPLDPDHEEHAREIATNEVRAFGRGLLAELGLQERRPDGNDLHIVRQAVERAVIRYERGGSDNG